MLELYCNLANDQNLFLDTPLLAHHLDYVRSMTPCRCSICMPGDCSRSPHSRTRLTQLLRSSFHTFAFILGRFQSSLPDVSAGICVVRPANDSLPIVHSFSISRTPPRPSFLQYQPTGSVRGIGPHTATSDMSAGSMFWTARNRSELSAGGAVHSEDRRLEAQCSDSSRSGRFTTQRYCSACGGGGGFVRGGNGRI